MRLPSNEWRWPSHSSVSSLHLPRPQSISSLLPSSSRDIIDYGPVDADGLSVLRPAIAVRYTVLAVLGTAAVCMIGMELFERDLVSKLDLHRSFQKTSAMSGAVSLVEMPLIPTQPYSTNTGCHPDGRICICSQGYAVSGIDKYGYNTFKKVDDKTPSTGCQQWDFQVGDVLLVDKPAAVKQAYIPAMVVASVTNSPIVHAAIVTEVPPPGVNQTAENVIVTEALKGSWQRLVQNTLRDVVERFPFGAISIRRIDAKRFPRFFQPQRRHEITQWARQRVGDGFDKQMLIPLKRRFTTKDRYTPIDPACEDRKKAMAKYKQGGPGQWICSEFVAWTIAFAGGINIDYGSLSDDCDVPPWTVKNLQPFPGDLADTEYFDPDIKWRMPCHAEGCFLAVPVTPEWAGGTTAGATTMAAGITTTRAMTSSVRVGGNTRSTKNKTEAKDTRENASDPPASQKSESKSDGKVDIRK